MAISLAIISLENPSVINSEHTIESHRNGLTMVTESFLLSVKFYSDQRDRQKHYISISILHIPMQHVHLCLVPYRKESVRQVSYNYHR